MTMSYLLKPMTQQLWIALVLKVKQQYALVGALARTRQDAINTARTRFEGQEVTDIEAFNLHNPRIKQHVAEWAFANGLPEDRAQDLAKETLQRVLAKMEESRRSLDSFGRHFSQRENPEQAPGTEPPAPGPDTGDLPATG